MGTYISGTKNGHAIMGYSANTPLIRVKRIFDTEAFALEMRRARATGKISGPEEVAPKKGGKFDAVAFAEAMVEARAAGLIRGAAPIPPMETQEIPQKGVSVECVICGKSFLRRKESKIKACSEGCRSAQVSAAQVARGARQRAERPPVALRLCVVCLVKPVSRVQASTCSTACLRVQLSASARARQERERAKRPVVPPRKCVVCETRPVGGPRRRTCSEACVKVLLSRRGKQACLALQEKNNAK